jgi:hypothetical protein
MGKNRLHSVSKTNSGMASVVVMGTAVSQLSTKIMQSSWLKEMMANMMAALMASGTLST